MRLAVRIGLFMILSGVFIAPASGQNRLFRFIDIAPIERESIEFRVVETDPPVQSESETFLSSRNAPAAPDQSLGLPVARLSLDAEGIRKLPLPAVGNELETPSALVEMTVAGYPVAMAVVEARSDPDFEAVHYTLLAINSDDYARLTVSVNGPEIVGTFFIGEYEFRVLPEAGFEEFQLVYPVVANIRQWRREAQADLSTRAGQLEARHLQIGWVADRRPGDFDTRPDGRPRLYAEGPSIGRMAFWSAYDFEASGIGEADYDIMSREFENFLDEIRYFTWIDEPVTVQVEEISSFDQTEINNEGITIVARQLLFGIPTSETLSLHMDASTDVMEYRGSLVRYDMAPDSVGEQILQDEALKASALALSEQYGIRVEAEVVTEELFYNEVSPDQLELIWRIDRRAECGVVFRVDIDAVTGERRNIRIIDTDGINARSTQDLLFQCQFYRAFRRAE